jgi:hypothetical protein
MMSHEAQGNLAREDLTQTAVDVPRVPSRVSQYECITLRNACLVRAPDDCCESQQKPQQSGLRN